MDKQMKWNNGIQQIAQSAIGEGKGLKIARLAEKLMKPYVPSSTGSLANDTLVYAKDDKASILYKKPYAALNYYMDKSHKKSVNPRASAYWDKAMIRDLGQEFTNQLKKI